MKPSFSPTIRRRRLARIFRDLREESGKTLEMVSKETGVPRATLGKLETAELKHIRTDQLDALAWLYDFDDDTWSNVQQLSKDAAERGWWAKYKDLYGRGDLPSFEVESSFIRVYESQVIPGLLQTSEYTRAVFTGTSAFPEDKIARHMDGRRERQAILEREFPPEYAAVLDESALRRTAGTPEIMREQLLHLVDLAKRPRMSIHVLPFDAGMHGATLGSFQIMEFPEPADPSIGFSETPTSLVFVEERDDMRRMDSMWREAHSASLTANQSIEFLERAIEDLGDKS